jgi:SAM-dependent methyltransferase
LTDRARFSRIAHRNLPWAAPVATPTVARLIETLVLPPGSSVLDVGCGRGALLMDIVEASGGTGVGIDMDAVSIRAASEAAGARSLSERVSFLESTAADFGSDERFELACCVGASHACGGYRQTLEYLLGYAGPDAYLLCGEGFWRRPPEPAYLAHIGASADEMGSHQDNMEIATSLGLSPAWCVVTSDQTWDEYEGLYRLAMLSYLRRHPDDPDHDAFMQRSDHWYDGYLNWGRETMGFAMYLFQRR